MLMVLPVGAAAANVPTGGVDVPLPTARILDTTAGIGASAKAVAANGVLNLRVLGNGGVPPNGVGSVTLTLTVSAEKAAGYITVYPTGQRRPGVSALSFGADQPATNTVIVPVGSGGDITIYSASSGTVEMLAAVTGYHTPAAAGSGIFHAITAKRILDTRFGIGAKIGAIGPHGHLNLSVSTAAGAEIASAAMNITVTQTTTVGYITAYPTQPTEPATTNISFGAVQTVTNLVIVSTSDTGQVTLENNSAGSVQLVADLEGYTLGAAIGAGQDIALPATRLLDTRSGIGAPAAAVKAEGRINLQIDGRGGAPGTGVGAALLDVTAVQPTATGTLTAYPMGQPQPAWADLDYMRSATKTTLVEVPVGANGQVTIASGSAGTVQVTADLVGYVDAPTQISAGDAHTCAVLADHRVQCWGDNSFGELGNGSMVSSPVPVAVDGLGGQVTQVSAGLGYTCALINTIRTLHGGSVECWGTDSNGQLGDGRIGVSAYPVAVAGLTGVISISSGSDHACAVVYTGGVRCWGNNAFGQIGDGTSRNERSRPVTVIGLTGVASVSAGNDPYTCAVLRSGAVDCWGENSDGELGDGTFINRPTPKATAQPMIVSNVYTGGGHTCALRVSGGLLCWGSNDFGQLGIKAGGNQPTPVLAQPIGLLSTFTRYPGATTGEDHTCIIDGYSNVKCWGLDIDGQLGFPANLAIPVGTMAPPALTAATTVTAGAASTCALRIGGSISCWGGNASGQLGDGTTVSRPRPEPVVGL